jgi:hypothetical protein
VISIESGGKSLTDWSYHTTFDTVEQISPEMLKQVISTLSAFLEQYKAE